MVPIATRLKLGSVLGYIIAGIAISPLLTVLKVDVLTLQHFAEFGVVMMLFLVGLELEPEALWKMKAKLLGLQVTVTIAQGNQADQGNGSAFPDGHRSGFHLRPLLDRHRPADPE